MFLRVALVVVLFTVSLAAQEEPPPRQVFFDPLGVAAYLGGDADFDDRLPLASSYRPARDPGESRSLVEPEFLVEEIRRLDGPDGEGLNGPAAQVLLVGGRIAVSGRPEDIASARRTLAFYERILATPVAVEVWSLDGGTTGPLDAAAASARIASDGARLLARRDVLPGQAARIAAARRDRFVAEFDVEIAQESTASDPIVRTVTTGLRVDLALDWTPGGSLFVEFSALTSALEGMDEIEAGAPGSTSIQLPRVRSSQVGGTALLSAGGGVVLRAQDRRDGGALLLRFIGQAPDFRLDDRALAIPAGALFMSEHRFAPVPLFNQSVYELDQGEGEEGRPLLESDWFMDFALATDPSFGQMSEHSIDRCGTRCIVTAAPEVVAKVAEFARGLHSELLRPRSIEMKIVALERGQGDAVERALASGTLLASGGTTALDGRAFRLLGGRERALVVDYNAEVAQKAFAYDPVVGLAFEGFVLDGRCEARLDGGISFRGAFAHARHRGEIASRPVVEARGAGGKVHLPSNQDSRIEIATVLKDDGSWQLAAITDTDAGPVGVLVRVRAG